jgi:hypothetical protein
MSQPSPDPARRRLLRYTGRATAAAAAVAVLGPTAAGPAATRAAPVQPEPGRGYRESEHTRRYYQLARF